MSRKTFLLISGAIFSIVAMAHLCRLTVGWQIVFGGWMVPMWFSGIGLVIALVLAYYGFRFGLKDK